MKKLKPYTGPWGKIQLLHLLRRSLWGVSVEDLAFFQGKTMKECLDVLLTPITVQPPPPVNAYSDADLKDPYVEFGQVWVNAPRFIEPNQQFSNNVSEYIEGRRNCSLKAWWTSCMINQDRSLTEKMVIFLHNSVATQSYEMLDARYTYKHVVLLRRHALGNFKTLVREVTTDPCMLAFLNGNTNVKGNPNENYGRELQELFTIGKSKDSHFTENDVKAAARVLTGWCDDRQKIESYFDPAKHDTSDKVFSAFYGNTVIKGRSGPKGAEEKDELIDMLFKNPETAKFLCRKLYRWFVHYDLTDTVEEEVIIPLADIVIKNNFNLAPVLRALLSSEWFYSEQLKGHMIKSGLDYGIGLIRQFNVALPPPTDLALLYTAWFSVSGGIGQFDQDIGDPPSVAGWPAYYEAPSYHKRWIDSNLIALRRSISSGFASLEGLPSEAWTFKIDFIKFVSKLNMPYDPDKLIDDSLYLLLPLDILAPQRLALVQILNNNSDDVNHWKNLWNTFTNDPNNQTIKDTINARLSAFYSNIMNLAEYQMM